MGTLYCGDNPGSVMCTFMDFLGANEMMVPRLIELLRALKLSTLPE